MRKLFWLMAAAAATPAGAQEGWPVARDGGVCTTSRGASATSDALILRYDPAAQRVIMQTTVESGGGKPGDGAIDLGVVFDKGGPREELDIGWGARQFAYRRGDTRLDLQTSFAGAKNVDQLLTDLANSKRLGLTQDGKTVADFDLAGIGPAIARLKECARGT